MSVMNDDWIIFKNRNKESILLNHGCPVGIAKVLIDAKYLSTDGAVCLSNKYLDGTLSEDMVKVFASNISTYYKGVEWKRTRIKESSHIVETLDAVPEGERKVPVLELYIDIVTKGCYDNNSNEFYGFTPEQAANFLKEMESAPYVLEYGEEEGIDSMVTEVYDRFMPYGSSDDKLKSVDDWMSFAKACASINPDECKEVVDYDKYGDKIYGDDILIDKWSDKVYDKVFSKPDSVSLDSNKSKSSDRDFD